MMKSGMGIDDVYIHTPSRIQSVAFVVSLATMLANVADDILRQTKPPGERKYTVKGLSDVLMNTLLWYRRRKNSISVTGGPGDTEFFLSIFRRFNIDHELLLGYV